MSTKRLKYKEFVPIGEELEIGEQIHINHENCPAGDDIKRRLYVKRGNDNGHDVIMAYCHHCGKSGSYNQAYSRVKMVQTPSTPTKQNAWHALPRDYTKVWQGWSPRARVWVNQYGISEQEAARWGIGYSSSEDKVVIPCFRNSRLKGYQLRALEQNAKPKYSTKANIKPLFWYSGDLGNTLAIVEDALSAIKCSRYCSSLALLSSGMSDEVLSFISKSGHNNFIVFLDDDNKQVKKSQIALKNRLELFGTVVVIQSGGRDPKEHSDEELRVLLCKNQKK